MQAESPHRRRLIIALGVVVTLHLGLLMIPVVFETSKMDNKSTTLKLTLKPNPAPSPVKPKTPAKTSVTIPEEELVSLSAIEQQEQSIAEISDELKPADEVERQNQSFDRNRVITAAIQSIRGDAVRTTPRGFSLEALRPKTEVRYQREQVLARLMAPTASNKSSLSSAGQSTDLVRGRNGKAACWQQRGTPGETQLWYRVPLSLCGHLNKP